MRTSRLKTLAAAVGLLALTGAAQAALIDRGGGMIYDSTRNLTWLSDMNYARTSGYDSDGRMSWSAANQWANNLVHGGFDDWRLPTLNPSDTSCSISADPGGGLPLQRYGFNCTGGELSGLFATELGNRANQSVLNQSGDTAEQIANLALFSNVQAYYYWSATPYAPNTLNGWLYNTSAGIQTMGGNINPLYAVAVRAGDVVASVPEPQTLALALMALAATAVVRRRRPR